MESGVGQWRVYDCRRGGVVVREIIVQGFVDRIKAGKMTLAQVPEVYREEVEALLDNVPEALKDEF